jgi:hypothetical protein
MIVVADIDSEYVLEMRPIQDEEPVEALRPYVGFQWLSPFAWNFRI